MRGLLAIFAITVAACGSDPADVAGDYTIAVTNQENGCNLENWTEGNTATGIQVTITQDGENVTATIQGLIGGYVSLVIGSNVFVGSVDGDNVSMQIIGTRSYTQGNCTYTFNAILHGDAEGDVMTGTITYTAATNDQTDCAALEDCASVQAFNGTRPPS